MDEPSARILSSNTKLSSYTHTHTAYCQSASISQSDGVWRGNRVAFVKLSLECGLNVCVCVCVCEYGGRRAAHFLWTDFGKTNILWSAVIVKYVCWHVLFHFTGSVPGMDGLSNTGQHTETNNRSCTIDTKVWSCDLFEVRSTTHFFTMQPPIHQHTYILNIIITITTVIFLQSIFIQSLTVEEFLSCHTSIDIKTSIIDIICPIHLLCLHCTVLSFSAKSSIYSNLLRLERPPTKELCRGVSQSEQNDWLHIHINGHFVWTPVN